MTKVAEHAHTWTVACQAPLSKARILQLVAMPCSRRLLFWVCFCVCSVAQLCSILCDPMEFSKQEYWSRLPFPPSGDLPNPGIKPTSLRSPALAGSLPLEGFPGGSDGKASACNAGDLGSIPGSRRSPGEGNGNSLQYSCLKNSMD